jgi:hypothetical protein
MSVSHSPDPRNLTWSHFTPKDSDPDGEGHDAHTGPKYDLDIPARGGIVKEGSEYKVVKVNVKVSLNPAKTWVVSGKKTDKLLEHERRHWMMDIIVGHEMEKAILGLSHANPNTLKQKIQAEFDWHRNKREKWLADKYDDETKHGAEATKQGDWERKVDSWFTSKSIPLTTPR